MKIWRSLARGVYWTKKKRVSLIKYIILFSRYDQHPHVRFCAQWWVPYTIMITKLDGVPFEFEHSAIQLFSFTQEIHRESHLYFISALFHQILRSKMKWNDIFICTLMCTQHQSSQSNILQQQTFSHFFTLSLVFFRYFPIKFNQREGKKFRQSSSWHRILVCILYMSSRSKWMILSVSSQHFLVRSLRQTWRIWTWYKK